MNQNWSPEEERLRAALNSAAENVTPGPDGLAQIRRRTAQGSWWRSPVFFGVAAGVATAAAAIVIAVNTLGTGDEEMAVSPADSPSAIGSTPSGSPDSTTGPVEPTEQPTDSSEPTGEPTEPGADPSGTDDAPPALEEVTLPVYFAVDGDITREWQADVDTRDPMLAALHRSLNGDTRDPRYGTLWAPVEVTSADVVDDVIEVDLASPVQLAADDPDLADEAVQQLVYTVTATASSTMDNVDRALPVRVLVDGAPPESLFGRLDLSEPVTRADQLDVRHPIQIDDPAYGAEMAGPVTVTGIAALFEATAEWELRNPGGEGDDGEVVDSGTVQTEEGQAFSPFDIELGELEPGEYEITVREIDASGGEGPDPRFETKRFTVVEP